MWLQNVFDTECHKPCICWSLPCFLINKTNAMNNAMKPISFDRFKHSNKFKIDEFIWPFSIRHSTLPNQKVDIVLSLQLKFHFVEWRTMILIFECTSFVECSAQILTNARRLSFYIPAIIAHHLTNKWKLNAHVRRSRFMEILIIITNTLTIIATMMLLLLIADGVWANNNDDRTSYIVHRTHSI